MMNESKQPYSRINPFIAKIKERKNLSISCCEKKVDHIVIDIKGSGITYNVGDCVGVYPVNDPFLVTRTLDALKAKGDETVTDKRSEDNYPLTSFLKIKANLTDINKRFLEEVALRQTNAQKRKDLEFLLLDENRDSLKEYLYGRHYWDVLVENPEVHFSPQEFSHFLMPLLPRYYSIASSQAVTPDEIHLTVKFLAYEAHGQERKGVCTHYLCNLAPTEEPIVPLFIQPHKGFTLPENSETPIIMVGPGTGVAPFRAFMQERTARGAKGLHWLFFGEWRREQHFLYGDYWVDLETKGDLRVSLAFSRDQDKKVYVQHRLLEHGEEIFGWLEKGANFYVCGDAHGMAKDVEAALIEIVKIHGNIKEDDAKAYIKKLRKDKRYLRDVY